MPEIKMTESKEWLDEPDREEFEHAGYRCLILRHCELLHLNGYVAVPRGHVCYGKDCDRLPYEDLLYVSAHGGLTFSDNGDGKFRPKGCWWFGFDCAHFNDLVPQILDLEYRFYNRPNAMKGTTYRNFNYVRQEVRRLAGQLADLDFIDWQFTRVWPFLLPVRTARWFWMKKRGWRAADDEDEPFKAGHFGGCVGCAGDNPSNPG